MPEIDIPIGATVKFDLDLVFIPINTVMGAPVLSTVTFFNPAAVTPANTHMLSEWNDFITNANCVSAIFIQRVRRNASGAGSDTFAGNVWLLGVDWHFQTDWPGGTKVEYP
jgi:hypothetical protein